MSGVKVGDVVMDESPCIHLRGKGRKQRTTPLWKSTVQEIRAWLGRNPTLGADTALLPNREGHAMTRFNVTQRLNIAVARAAKVHSSLLNRSISPHSIRHYLPFLTMSSNVKDSVGMFGIYYSRRLKAYLNTRHSFRLETVEKI